MELCGEAPKVDPLEVSRVLKAAEDVQNAQFEVVSRRVATTVDEAWQLQLGEGFEGFLCRVALAKRRVFERVFKSL